MQRQITNLQFLFYGKDNLIPMRVGKRCTAQNWRKPFSRIHMLLPCQNPFCTTCPTPSISERAVAAQQNSPECSLPHCWAHNLLTRENTASSVNKPRMGTALLASTWLTRQAHCTHLTDPVSQHTMLNQKDPTGNRRTCSISNFIVLNVASSLQRNGNIKSHSTGIPPSLWSRVGYCCICNR